MSINSNLQRWLNGDALDESIETAESLRAQNSGKRRKLYPYAARKHADGSVCKAASPETCPFNKKAEKAETAITGKEHSVDDIKKKFDGLVEKYDEYDFLTAKDKKNLFASFVNDVENHDDDISYAESVDECTDEYADTIKDLVKKRKREYEQEMRWEAMEEARDLAEHKREYLNEVIANMFDR